MQVKYVCVYDYIMKKGIIDIIQELHLLDFNILIWIPKFFV